MKVSNLFEPIFSGNQNSGQILLVVILTLVIVLTVGLSVASRSITNVKISKQNEESQRAFQAAEAGVEQILQQYVGSGTNTLSNQNLGNNARFSTNLSAVNGASFFVNGNTDIQQDIGADVQLSTSAGLRLTIYYAESNQSVCAGTGDNVTPALEVIVLTNQANPSAQKYIVDSCGGRSNTVGTKSPVLGSASLLGQSYRQRVQIPPASDPALANGWVMKVVPLYNTTKIGISSTVALPEQGRVIASTGRSGETVRKVQYFESLPEIPTELFQYALLSQ